MPHKRQHLGATGEGLAVRHLQAAGLTIIERNWRCAAGELDIIAQEDAPNYGAGGALTPWLAVIEVRTRRGDRFGTARQSITPRKAAKVIEVATCYVQDIQWQGPWRIDLVAVQMDAQGHLMTIDHIRHAITGP